MDIQAPAILVGAMGIGGDSFRKNLGSKTSETNLLEIDGKRLGVDVGCLLALHQLAAFHAPDLVMKADPTKIFHAQ